MSRAVLNPGLAILLVMVVTLVLGGLFWLARKKR